MKSRKPKEEFYAQRYLDGTSNKGHVYIDFSHHSLTDLKKLQKALAKYIKYWSKK